jgi:hypothetical protein
MSYLEAVDFNAAESVAADWLKNWPLALAVDANLQRRGVEDGH